MSTISIIGSGGMAAAIGSLAAKAGHAVEVTSRNVAMAGTLEKGPAGKNWHGIEGDGIRFREIAEAIGSRLGLPAVSIPADVLMLPAYFGFLANLVTLDQPHHPPDPRLGTRSATPACRFGQRPLLRN